MDTQLLLDARRLVENVTPLRTDCGLNCGRACCAPDEDGQGGVYLFPGEEALLSGVSWARIEPRSALPGAPMLVCNGSCARRDRPLGCRIFPLTPVWRGDGRLTVKMDRRAFAMCPLARHGIKGLSPEFVSAVREALRLIESDAQGAAFLRAWAALEARYGQWTL